ncbi:MAG TPA: carbohydrate ABC transporter permease [Rectinema sp.]|nr:carbohydrate ABC transporter permease [Rectinema sp.]HOO02433.1 carbohydrate ABC transporter permease [Rectinema sp.]HQJ22949.1 carbohydrate ABC transporter permease [Rectinema sp.]
MTKLGGIKHNKKLNPPKIIVYGSMYILGIIYLVPLIWMLRTALISPDKAIDLFSLSWPTLANLKRVLLAAPFGQYYINTIIMVIGTLAAQFVLITMAGYAFARLDFWGKNILFMLFLMQLMITPDVLIMPNYSFMGQLGLIDTKLGVILPFFASGMGTFLMRQTIKTIPYELEEAAKMDGCRLPRMLLQIYVPLLKPVYIAFGLISASYQWNNFLWPLVMINSVSKRPLTVGLAIFAMSFETGAQWSDVCAATLIVIAPLLIMFLFFQRQFIESFAHSGIK